MLQILINSLILILAVLHFYFLYLEMFLWTKPNTLKKFNMSLEFATQSSALAANQGLYNGFLAAGLLYSLVIKNYEVANHFQLFFLACIFIAGLYGGKTVSKRILLYQSIPSLLILFLKFMA